MAEEVQQEVISRRLCVSALKVFFILATDYGLGSTRADVPQLSVFG